MAALQHVRFKLFSPKKVVMHPKSLQNDWKNPHPNEYKDNLLCLGNSKNEEIAKRLNCASSACCTASFACCAAAAARRSPSSAARQRSAWRRGSQKNTIDKIAIRKVLWIIKLVLKSSQYVSDENKLIHSLQLYASLGFLICCQF